ncbi:hypothetical protein HDV06_004073 [Boothiomyces sp. JEL0866]|nr:hypothetical protein HDV06_004073 [Boothiomyces sp. JEL0866]
MVKESDKEELDLQETEFALKELRDLAQAEQFILVSNNLKGGITANEELFLIDLETQDITTIQLDCPIEYMAISSQMLVIADALGSLSFIDFNGSVVHSILLNNSNEKKKFQGLFFNDDFELIVLFAGNLLKITTEPTEDGMSMDNVKHNLIKLNMEFSAVQKYSLGSILIASGDSLLLYDTSVKESINFKQAIHGLLFLNGMIVIHLKSCLYVVDAESFLIAKKLDIIAKSVKKLDEFHILLEFDSTVKIIDTRGFKAHHFITDIEIGGLTDDLYVVLKDGKLKLCERLETDPKEILLQLLCSNPGQAEEYALNNNVSHEDLSKLKLSACAFDEIVENLNEISDINYLHRFCLDFHSKTQTELKTIYQYAKNRFALLKLPNIVREFSILISRVNTFSEIQTLKDYSTYWPDIQVFLKSKMILNFQLLLSLECYELALLICRRHKEEMELAVNLELLLSYIPPEIPANTLILILAEIEGKILEKEGLYQWVLDRAEGIEKQSQAKDALFLLKWAALNLKTKDASTTPSMYISSIAHASANQKLINSRIMIEITKRISQLEDAIDLADRHNFHINIEDYKSTSIQAIAMSMLDRVQSPDDILLNIDAHIKPFLKKHCISLNIFLVEYTKDLIQSAEYTEPRIFPILSLIQCQTYRSEILIDLMRRSPIPWSENLDDLIKESLQYENKLSTDLAEQYKMMELKRMVKSYGVEKFNVSDKLTALKIISLILSNESACALEDAMMVSEVYGISKIEVYVQRLQYLIGNSSLSQLKKLIKDGTELEEYQNNRYKHLAQEELDYVLKHIDTWILFKLDGMQLSDYGVFQSFLEAGSLISTSPVYSQTLNLCLELKRNITPKQLEDKDFTLVLLDEYISSCNGAEGQCIRIGDLLGFEQHITLSRIGRYYALEGDSECVFAISKELVKLDVESASELISNLINDLIKNASKYVDRCLEISLSLLEMSKLTVRYCKGNLLDFHMSRFKRLEIAHQIIMQTDLGAYKQSVVNSETNSYTDGLFEEMYQDAGLVSSSSKILPDLVTFIKTQDLKENAPSSKGKGKSAEIDVYSAAFNVAKECFSTRNFGSCIRLCQLLKVQFNSQTSEDLDNMINDSVVSTLQNLLATSNLDYSYSLGCMLYLPIGKSNELFKNGISNAGKDYLKLERIGNLGALAGKHWNQRNFQVNCLQLVIHSKWLQELKLLELPCEEMLFKAQTPQGDEYRRAIVPYLLFKTGDLSVGEDFADQFNIEMDYVYKKYIQQQLFIHSEDSDRDSKVVFAIEKYTNKMLLLDVLTKEYFVKMSSYDYQGLLFLCQQIIYLDPMCKAARRNKAILDILLRYQRTSLPKEDENTIPDEIDFGLTHIEKTWKTSNEIFHALKCSRLPFHQILSDPYEILSAEITESTISKLIPLTQVLELTTDKFYEALINQKIQKLQSEHKQYIALEEYELRAISRDITFNDFKPLLSKIVDSELLVKTTVYVAGNFPRGEDRIAAYKSASYFAEKWVKSLQSNKDSVTLEMAMTGVSKIKNMLSIAETENSLQLYGLQLYDKLVTKPNSLIAQLLTHEENRPSLEVSTFHKLAEEVAKRNNIDLEKLKLMLLQKWITTDVVHSALELQDRVLFLFYGKLEWGVGKLYAFSQLISINARIQSLSLILRFTMDTQQQFKNIDPQTIQKKVAVLTYLKDFESIGFPQHSSDFENSDKLALVRSLWLSYRNYSVFDLELWANVLDNLSLAQMPCQVQHSILKQVIILPELSTLRNLKQVWSNALLCCIEKWFDGEDDLSKLCDYVDCLTQIEFLTDEFVDRICGFCKTHQSSARDTIASFAMVHRLPASYFANEFSNFLQWEDEIRAVETLIALTDYSQKYAFVAEIQGKLASIIFDLLNYRGLYLRIGSSPCMEAFVKYLIKKDRITSLLAATMKASRTGDAIKLWKLYKKYHGLVDDRDEMVQIEGYLNEAQEIY